MQCISVLINIIQALSACKHNEFYYSLANERLFSISICLKPIVNIFTPINEAVLLETVESNKIIPCGIFKYDILNVC